MDLNFNIEKAKGYTSGSQIARVLTEHWVQKHSYCPNCGTDYPQAFENNRPVADFYCASCLEKFELKSKRAENIGKRIVDGAYSTMINRIESDSNPNFFFLTYDNASWSVKNFVIIPKHYFTKDIIEKRNPLGPTARRAGWVGCNINLSKVPSSGRIFIVRDSVSVNRQSVLNKWQSTTFLQDKHSESKGWILDIMNCVDSIKDENFSLRDMYRFESVLKEKYPQNNFIKDKIRQQLQLLRDKGLIEFVGRGAYRKVSL